MQPQVCETFSKFEYISVIGDVNAELSKQKQGSVGSQEAESSTGILATGGHFNYYSSLLINIAGQPGAEITTDDVAANHTILHGESVDETILVRLKTNVTVADLSMKSY